MLVKFPVALSASPWPGDALIQTRTGFQILTCSEHTTAPVTVNRGCQQHHDHLDHAQRHSMGRCGSIVTSVSAPDAAIAGNL
jgi:hypothetical protein